MSNCKISFWVWSRSQQSLEHRSRQPHCSSEFRANRYGWRLSYTISWIIAILVASKPLQCMALMMLAAWHMAHTQEVRIDAGCMRKGQRLDKTVKREFSFAHASDIRTVAPFGAILRASQQTVLSFRNPSPRGCTDRSG